MVVFWEQGYNNLEDLPSGGISAPLYPNLYILLISLQTWQKVQHQYSHEVFLSLSAKK